MFEEAGRLVFGDEIVLPEVDFQYMNESGSPQALVTNVGMGTASDVTLVQYQRFKYLIRQRGKAWKMIFADGRQGKILPQFPSRPTNFPGRIDFQFFQNSPMR